jgi:hypothetical protein
MVPLMVSPFAPRKGAFVRGANDDALQRLSTLPAEDFAWPETIVRARARQIARLRQMPPAN